MNPEDAELLARLNEGKIVQISPRGISMLPFIHCGHDKVRLRKDANVAVGDIVLAYYQDHLILHRIYAIEGERFILMGDGNLKGNEVVDRSDVWGKAIGIVKENGRCQKPHKARFWRHTLPLRRIMLKIRRKWYKLRNLNPE